MLGKTNLLFVEGEGSTELTFNQDFILTPSSANILKIEYINDTFFVFTSQVTVLYGNTVDNLQVLKKDGENFAVKYIVYADGVYYMTTGEEMTGKAVIYKTSDLSVFEEITILSENESYSYKVPTLLLTSDKRIVLLLFKYEGSYRHSKRLMVLDSLMDYNVDDSSYIEIDQENVGYSFDCCTFEMRIDKIFERDGRYQNNCFIYTLDGTYHQISKVYNHFAAGYFFVKMTAAMYYSINGIDYLSLDFSNVKDFSPGTVFEYDGNIALIYSCTENESTVKKMIIASTPKGLVDATNNAIPVAIDYVIHSDLYKEDYAYLGCTGGIIIKAKLEYSDSSLTPEVVVIKTLAAKEALAQSKRYTDEQVTVLEARVAALEEWRTQYTTATE